MLQKSGKRIRLPGLSCTFQNITYDRVTDFDVMEVFQTDAAFEARADFTHIFLLVFERSHFAFEEQVLATE
jgi:hypothetical protein